MTLNSPMRPGTGIAAPAGFTMTPAEMASNVGPYRGFSLNCATLAVLGATAASQEEVEELWEEFSALRDTLVKRAREDDEINRFINQLPELAGPLQVCRSFFADIGRIDRAAFPPDRPAAKILSKRARADVLPALYAIIARLTEEEEALRADAIRAMGEKAELVDKMLTEMTRIGRMIGLISINASVEAARAGGESGRSFQVIAEEVRSLAAQSADLMDNVRKRMRDDGQPTETAVR